MQQVVRDNHYVPQGLIRRWSTDGLRVHAYRTLVSHGDVPLWTSQSIQNVACARDLYTDVVGGQEHDDFEKWIESEFEGPGLAAVERLVRGLRLSPNHWRDLIRLYAAQHVRTPSSYSHFMRWCGKELEPALDASLSRMFGPLQNAKRGPPAKATADASPTPTCLKKAFESLLRVRVDEAADAEGRVAVRAEIAAGRSFWIAWMRHLLNGIVKSLYYHRWRVLIPHGDAEWVLTDHPALRVNYNGPRDYSVEGGWGFEGSDLMMPVSPRHLLHVQVGHRGEPRAVCSEELTLRIQRLYAETALRWILSTSPHLWVAHARPRVVDAVRFKDEQEQWRGWHENQKSAEEW